MIQRGKSALHPVAFQKEESTKISKESSRLGKVQILNKEHQRQEIRATKSKNSIKENPQKSSQSICSVHRRKFKDHASNENQKRSRK